jgi:predicted Fe-S protein YdhL (DUF1289 family)
LSPSRPDEGRFVLMRHSPCIGICKLDDATGYCLGCGRTGSEIGDWISMSEGQRDTVWQKLPARLSVLSARVRLIPWTRDELVDWVRDSIVTREGVWVVGAAGAVAEFLVKRAPTISIDVEPGMITARTPDASFRLRINEKVRAFAFADGGPIALGLPKARAAIRSAAVLELLGSDGDAINEDQRGAQLFDLGIGRPSSRFCIRTGDEILASALSDHAGRHWPEVLAAIGKQIISARPTRIAESAAARIEVFAKVPSPGGQLPAGADMRFAPEFVKEETITNLALPDYAAPVAIFYPDETTN